MHFENFWPLMRYLPLLALALAAFIALPIISRGRRRSAMRREEESWRRYWVAEMAHQAKMRAFAWLNRGKVPRLTYRQGTADLDGGK